ncbi:hypothetical protein FNF31_06750 [Cafeteria roenbergensis]|uniref:Alanine dehydrogenase/pyridine nucleotide transhydrogenase N-terminal domain-containing protein n=1 Tax=Cafeteria roenbergensis TaxID=33653 RepID=A0A5A8CGP5_CAFRO|nr:hypothetical protein FNF31_06750 [Cafeteria roenbergensis]
MSVGVVGIRREDKSIWERRVALTPDNVRELVSTHGLRVLVQPSPRRVFDDSEYAAAGAEVTEDLSPAATILGVKEVPPSALLKDRTYVFFSHTIKAQPYNMPLLDRILEQRVRLVDYECITKTGRRGDPRLVAFGRFAGIAGAVDFLRGMGERLLHQGFNTPMLALGSTYMYPNEAAWRAAVKACGQRIADVGLPEELCPYVCTVTGRGNVSKGVQEILELLPHKRVAPEDLPSLMELSGPERTRQIFICETSWQHMVRRRPGVPSDAPAGTEAAADADAAAAPAAAPAFAADDPLASRDEFHEHPERYESVFHQRVAPYTSALFVCHYWEARFPRTLTVKQTQRLHSEGRLRLSGVCDISCDMRGAVEFLTTFTSIERPFYVWDPATDSSHTDGDIMGAPGILYHAVDHLPSECPLEASQHFGHCLMPFVPALARSSPTAPISALGPDLNNDDEDAAAEEAAAAAGSADFLPAPIRGAVVTACGEMAPQFRYILRLRAAHEAAAHKRVARLRRRESFVTLRLRGHLFDSGAINLVLDAVEAVEGASCDLTSVAVGKSGVHESEAKLSLFAGNPGELSHAVRAVVEAARSKSTRVEVTGGDEDDDALPASPSARAPASPEASPAVPDIDFAAAAAAAAAAHPLGPTGGMSLDATTSDDSGIDAMVAASARHHPTPAGGSAARRPAAGSAAASAAPDSAGGLRSSPPKRILLLGAGMMTKPLLRYLLRRPNNTITVCSGIPGEAAALCAGRPRTFPKDLSISANSMEDQPELRALVASHDIAVSLLPAFLHVSVARQCLAEGRHLVTASYVSDEMATLDEEAKARGILLLNEMGVDPGFDHMSAMRMIAAARDAGERIVGFSSSTGGLPAPEAANNPLGYKFSWSPRGALVAARNAALFVADGARVTVPSAHLLATAKPFRAGRGFALEVLPNRDSCKYASKYGLGEDDTVGTDKAPADGIAGLFRGTLRYAGFSRQLLALAALGLLDAEPAGAGTDPILDAAAAAADGSGAAPSLLEWTASKAGTAADADAVVAAACDKADAVLAEAGSAPLTAEQREQIGVMMRFAGLLDASTPVPVLPADKRSAVDTMAALLGPKPSMNYADNERDMVIMQHTVDTVTPSGERRQRNGLMVEYERDGETAMARTVGLTAAIGAQLILDGAIVKNGTGLHPRARAV